VLVLEAVKLRVVARAKAAVEAAAKVEAAAAVAVRVRAVAVRVKVKVKALALKEDLVQALVVDRSLTLPESLRLLRR
tara:strand:+ start:100 stop:330 length:231 start_codon:yes stop_codon:yes gene_type:complete